MMRHTTAAVYQHPTIRWRFQLENGHDQKYRKYPNLYYQKQTSLITKKKNT